MQSGMRSARECFQIKIQAVGPQDVTKKEEFLEERLPWLSGIGGDIESGGSAPVEKELAATIADGFHHRAIFLRIADLLGDDFEVNPTADRLCPDETAETTRRRSKL